jgi:hypothetical protein
MSHTPGSMDFDQRKAFQAGQEAAVWISVHYHGQLFQFYKHRTRTGEELVEMGFSIRKLVEIMQLAKKFPVDKPAFPKFWLELTPLLDPEIREEDIEAIQKKSDKMALAAGVPLDDILPEEVRPEDAYWLLGFEEKVSELARAK